MSVTGLRLKGIEFLPRLFERRFSPATAPTNRSPDLPSIDEDRIELLRDLMRHTSWRIRLAGLQCVFKLGKKLKPMEYLNFLKTLKQVDGGKEQGEYTLFLSLARDNIACTRTAWAEGCLSICESCKTDPAFVKQFLLVVAELLHDLIDGKDVDTVRQLQFLYVLKKLHKVACTVQMRDEWSTFVDKALELAFASTATACANVNLAAMKTLKSIVTDAPAALGKIKQMVDASPKLEDLDVNEAFGELKAVIAA